MGLFTTLSLVSLRLNNEAYFYYYFSSKEILCPQKNTLLLKFSKDFSQKDIEQFLLASDSTLKIHWYKPVYASLTFVTEKSLHNVSQRLQQRKDILSEDPSKYSCNILRK